MPSHPFPGYSDQNATTTPLADEAVYTGTWEHNSFNDVLLMVVADTDCTIQAQFSDDGTTAHSTVSYVHVADVPSIHRLVKAARFVRFLITNDSGGAQATLVFRAYFGSFGPLSAPLNSNLGKSADAIVTRNVPTNVDVSLGRLGGFEAADKWGHNPNVDTNSDPEDVWAAGGLMNWPSVAAQLSVVSDSADDDGDPAGSGALTFTIEGLDADWNAVVETITLNGTTPVLSPTAFIRINRAYVQTVGTYHGTNLGNITGTIGGDTMLFIPIGAGQTQLGRYSVPAGKTLLVTQTDVIIGGSKTATVKMWRVPDANDVSDPFGGAQRILREWDTTSGQVAEEFRTPVALPQYTDIWFEIAEVGANSTVVTATFNGTLADN